VNAHSRFQHDAGQRWRPRRRGFAIAIVLWAVAIVAVMLAGIQIASFRQAASGREALARVRAMWAARAGIENVIAKVQGQTRQSTPVSTVAIVASIAAEADGVLPNATWRIERTDENGTIQPGILDAHTRININLMTNADLILLPDMTDEISGAIIDYIDADEDPGTSGAENETYGSLEHSYKARNAPIRNLAELDLVYNVRPEYVRGIDGDLDNIVSARERGSSDQTSRTSSVADAGWSAYVTAASSTSGLSPTGDKKIDLTATQSSELTALLGINTAQADGIISAAAVPGATMETFLRTSLSTLATQAAQASGTNLPANRRPQDLTTDQLALLYDDCTIGDPALTKPGKVNLNTVTRDTLNYLSTVDQTLADEIIEYRDSKGGEVASITELLQISGITRAQLATLATQLDVQSTVFSATSRGRDNATGIEVEMIVDIDRSTMPVTIRSLRVK